MTGPRTPEERRAYRAFLRAAHPDRGGDPEAFVAGLARWREPAPASLPVFHRRRRGLGALLERLRAARRRRQRPPRVH